MRRIAYRSVAVLLALSFAASLLAPASAAEPVAKGVFPYPIHRGSLPNGLQVVTVPTDSVGTLSYYTVVRTGSRNEIEPGLSGFAHFFEHMMFRGTPRYSTEKYNDKLKEFGVDSNAFTTDDWTCYHLTASVGALDTIVELEADRFQNLAYDRAGFQKEARAVLGEYNKIASSPMLPLEEKLQDLSYNKHTYKHTTIGFLKDIVDMPNQYEYSRTFFERWYRPDNCIVLVVGDVKHEALMQLVRRHYSAWKGSAAKIDIPVEPPQTAEKRAHLTWPSATLPYLYLGYHVPGFDAKSSDIAALDVLGEAMFSSSSPLYQKLVLEQGKVEGMQGGATFRRDPTQFTVMARLMDVKDMPAVEEEIYKALAEAAEKPMSAQRLADIKSHLRYGFAPDTTDEVAMALGTYLQLTGDPDSLNQMYAGYDRVTAADVQRVAKKYFAKTNRTVITLAAEAADAKKTTRVAPKAQGLQPLGLAAVETSPPASADCGAEQAAAKPAAAAAVKQPKLTHLPTSGTRVALRFAFRAGSMNDPKGKEGLAALTARMLSEGGSQEVPYTELLDKLYPMAGTTDSQCDKELVVYTGKVHRDKLDEFYRLFADTLLKPRFSPDDFERLKAEQISYLAASLRGNNDESLGKWTMQLALYPPSHPYGHVDYGTVQGLKSITLDDVKHFYRQHFIAENLDLGIAGSVESPFLASVRSEFARQLPQGEEEALKLPAPAALKGLQVTIVEKPCIATAISLGIPLNITRADDDFYALVVANSAFGEHRTFNGRLMINMRGKRGLNYGDYSYIENFLEDSGTRFPLPNITRQQQYFSIWIRPVPHDKAVFALRQAVRELERLVRDGLTQEEFEASRNFVFNYSKLWVQDQSRRLGYQMDGDFYGRKSVVDELAERLPKMTLAQVNAAIAKHFQASNLAVAVVTKDGNAFKDKLLSGDPTPLVYDTEGTPAEVLTEDKIIASYPLKLNLEKLRVVPVAEMFEK